MRTPILFITFNRLDTTKQVFEQIKKVKPIKLYLASDGARENVKGEKEKIEEVRKYILDNVDWQCEIKTLFKNSNFGCGLFPYLSITWLFENEEKGIILEDDCVPSIGFFYFCEKLLDYYEKDPRIGLISGFNPFYMDININTPILFSKYSVCWGGWATWKRVWKNYDWEMKDFKIRWIEVSKKFNNYLLKKYWENLFKVFYYKIHRESWDEKLQYVLFKNSQLVVYPNMMLVKNIGFGIDSTHCFRKPEHIKKAERFFKKEQNFLVEYSSLVDFDLSVNQEFEKLLEKKHYKVDFLNVFFIWSKVILGKYLIFRVIFYTFKNIKSIWRKIYFYCFFLF